MTENFNRWDYYFKQAGEKWSVDWKLLKAISMNESSLGTNKSVKLGLENPKNVAGSASSDGKSWGIMQMTIKTAKDFDPTVTPQMLNNPEYSIDLAAQFIKHLKKYFKPTDLRYTEWVVKSYNQGMSNTKDEIAGKNLGFANEYWRRFKNNYEVLQAYL